MVFCPAFQYGYYLAISFFEGEKKCALSGAGTFEPPISLFGLPKRETGRSRSKEKKRRCKSVTSAVLFLPRKTHRPQPSTEALTLHPRRAFRFATRSCGDREQRGHRPQRGIQRGGPQPAPLCRLGGGAGGGNRNPPPAVSFGPGAARFLHGEKMGGRIPAAERRILCSWQDKKRNGGGSSIPFAME